MSYLIPSSSGFNLEKKLADIEERYPSYFTNTHLIDFISQIKIYNASPEPNTISPLHQIEIKPGLKPEIQNLLHEVLKEESIV